MRDVQALAGDMLGPKGQGRLVGRLAAVVFAAGLALSFMAAPAASADGGREIRLEDKCDPATFNAAVGPGTCIGDGDVTFDELIERVNPDDFGHGAWRFTREELTIRRGEKVRLINRGGEVHSFTEVLNFGPGIVPPLNAVFPPDTPPAVPVNPDPDAVNATFLPPGAQVELSGLSRGAHKFICLIHPWMQSTIKVR